MVAGGDEQPVDAERRRSAGALSGEPAAVQRSTRPARARRRQARSRARRAAARARRRHEPSCRTRVLHRCADHELTVGAWHEIDLATVDQAADAVVRQRDTSEVRTESQDLAFDRPHRRSRRVRSRRRRRPTRGRPRRPPRRHRWSSPIGQLQAASPDSGLDDDRRDPFLTTSHRAPPTRRATRPQAGGCRPNGRSPPAVHSGSPARASARASGTRARSASRLSGPVRSGTHAGRPACRGHRRRWRRSSCLRGAVRPAGRSPARGPRRSRGTAASDSIARRSSAVSPYVTSLTGASMPAAACVAAAPGVGSMTATARPRCANRQAAERPITPPPTKAASNPGLLTDCLLLPSPA